MRKYKGIMVIVVILLIMCMCTIGIIAVVSLGEPKGNLKDFTNITKWNGAITGTSYEQATEELDVTVMDKGGELEIEVTFLEPNKVPYREIEQLGIGKCKIVDVNGKTIVKDIDSEMAEVMNGKAIIVIDLEDVQSGNYKLLISEMLGGSKADQPTTLSGSWECEFVH